MDSVVENVDSTVLFRIEQILLSLLLKNGPFMSIHSMDAFASVPLYEWDRAEILTTIAISVKKKVAEN